MDGKSGRDQRPDQQGLLQQENGQWPKAGQWGRTGGCGCGHMGTVSERTCHVLNEGARRGKSSGECWNLRLDHQKSWETITTERRRALGRPIVILGPPNI